MNGTFCWFDLSTTDAEAAQRFYASLFGWTTESHRMGPDMTYTMWKRGDTTFGGVMTLADEAKQMGAPPHWLGYVLVADVDQAAEKCTSLGGRVFVPPADIPGAGRFAVLADPHGAAFAVYGHSGEEPAGPAPEMPVSWHECYTNDLESCWSFYEAMFGWHKTEAMDMGPEMGIYQMYGVGGKTLGGMSVKPKDMPVAAWLYYFHVDSAEATTAKAKELGATVIHGPMEVPGGDWITMFMDPQGAMFAVHSNGK